MATAAASSGPVRTFRVTPEGRYWLLGAGILWGAGLYKGINLITLLATLLATIWALNALWAGRRLVRLRLRRLVQGPVFAGTPCGVHVEVENPDRADQFGVRLEDRGPGHSASWFAVRLARGATAHWHYEATLHRRGWYAWGPLRATSGFPLGLVERSVAGAEGERVLVYPRLGRLHRGRLRWFLHLASPSPGRVRRKALRHPGALSEFHGLRDFRTGDSPRLIHWRTSARRGELMVREFEETPNDNLVLVLDTRSADDKVTRWQGGKVTAPQAAPGGVSETEGGEALPGTRSPCQLFEEAVSLAATVCWEWCRQKGDHLVLAAAGHPPVIIDGVTGLDHALRLMECLALVQETPAPDDGALAERLAATALPAGPVLVVSARPSGLADTLAGRLHRTVASLDLSATVAPDFYERPADHAS